MRGDQKLFEPP